MKTRKSAANSNELKKKLWKKTRFANLIRYVPSGVYSCRIRVRGELIRKSLKTDVLSVAKLRLGDEETQHRQTAGRQIALQRGRGKMTFGEGLKVYRGKLDANQDIKSKTKDYYKQCVAALLRTWPELEKINVQEISRQDCEGWATKFKGNATAFNNTVVVLRAILDICVEHGVIYENVATKVNRRTVKPKELHLPNNDQFAALVREIESAGGRFSPDCADLIRFLTFGGFRLGEAKNITWADCDFARDEIIVHGDPVEGTKGGDVRRVPMITEMRQLLEKMKIARDGNESSTRVTAVGECQQAMD